MKLVKLFLVALCALLVCFSALADDAKPKGNTPSEPTDGVWFAGTVEEPVVYGVGYGHTYAELQAYAKSLDTFLGSLVVPSDDDLFSDDAEDLDWEASPVYGCKIGDNLSLLGNDWVDIYYYLEDDQEKPLLERVYVAQEIKVVLESTQEEEVAYFEALLAELVAVYGDYTEIEPDAGYDAENEIETEKLVRWEAEGSRITLRFYRQLEKYGHRVSVLFEDTDAIG